MRLPLLVAAFMLSFPAVAQTPPAGMSAPAANAPPATTSDTQLPSTQARPAARAGRRHTQAQRFEEANTTHDGKLTLDQARAAHMNAVVRDFSAIDKDGKGYVTMTNIRDHRREVRASRRAAHP